MPDQDPNAPAVLPTEEVAIPPKVEAPPVAPAAEKPEEEVAEPFKSFATEEEYNAWVEEEREKLLPPAAEPTPEPVSGELRVFESGWKPKDWNDFAVQLLKNPNAAKILQEKIVPETRKAIAEMTEKEKQELEQINVGYDKEYNSLVSKGLLPSLDSKEGQRLNQEISLVGAVWGQVSLTKAYDLWKKIPKSEGGGFEYVPPAKERLNAQKQAAGKVGSPQGGQPKPVTGGKGYKDVHLRSLDDQVEEALSQ